MRAARGRAARPRRARRIVVRQERRSPARADGFHLRRRAQDVHPQKLRPQRSRARRLRRGRQDTLRRQPRAAARGADRRDARLDALLRRSGVGRKDSASLRRKARRGARKAQQIPRRRGAEPREVRGGICRKRPLRHGLLRCGARRAARRAHAEIRSRARGRTFRVGQRPRRRRHGRRGIRPDNLKAAARPRRALLIHKAAARRLRLVAVRRRPVLLLRGEGGRDALPGRKRRHARLQQMDEVALRRGAAPLLRAAPAAHGRGPRQRAADNRLRDAALRALVL